MKNLNNSNEIENTVSEDSIIQDLKNSSIVTVGIKGGILKTSVCDYITEMFDIMGVNPRLAEFDNSHMFSRLRPKERFDYIGNVTVSADEANNNSTANLKLWLKLSSLLEKGNVIIDTPANGADSILDTLEHIDIIDEIEEGMPRIKFLFFTNSNTDVFKDIVKALVNYANYFGTAVDYYLVRTPMSRDDKFSTIENKEAWKTIEEAKENLDLTVIDIPFLNSKLASEAYTQGISPFRLIENRTWATKFGMQIKDTNTGEFMDKAEVKSNLKFINNWAGELKKELVKILPRGCEKDFTFRGFREPTKPIFGS